MKVNCDECKKDFEMEVKVERIRNEQTLMRKYVKEFENTDSIGRKLLLSKKIKNLSEKIAKDIAWLKKKYNY